jgi:hypothetical protein
MFIRLATVILGLTMAAVPLATPVSTIRVWKIGSPHNGSIPSTRVPAAFRQELAQHGVALEVHAFPASGFAAFFTEAVRQNAAPDIVAFDTFGIMDGTVSRGEKFDGIGEDPLMRRDLIRVTTAYDALLAPARGWIYLVSTSANHAVARAFALATPACGSVPAVEGRPDPAELAPTLASAYLEGDAATLQAHADPDRITRLPATQNPVKAGAVVVCGTWGNSKLAFVRVLATYQGQDTIGRVPLMLVLRNASARWQLLVGARDPVTNGVFTTELRALTARLRNDGQPSVPSAATALRPADGVFPAPVPGQRFGAFSWVSSQSDEVVGEITEFAYKDDARLFVRQQARPGTRAEISTGLLWSTRDWWSWRIWSITARGDVAFSEVRSFYH